MPRIIGENLEYVPWLSDDFLVHNVRFEDLIKDPSAIEGISEFIGLPLAENHFDNIWGDTYTFTGKLSDWQEYWNDAVESAWISHGGLELEKALGYET